MFMQWLRGHRGQKRQGNIMTKKNFYLAPTRGNFVTHGTIAISNLIGYEIEINSSDNVARALYVQEDGLFQITEWAEIRGEPDPNNPGGDIQVFQAFGKEINLADIMRPQWEHDNRVTPELDYRVHVDLTVRYTYSMKQLQAHKVTYLADADQWMSFSYKDRAYIAAKFDLLKDAVGCQQHENEFVNLFSHVVTEYDPNKVVAYFDSTGKVCCSDCLTSEPAVTPVKIYACNLSPYKQDCHRCGKVVFDGSSGVILFDKKDK